MAVEDNTHIFKILLVNISHRAEHQPGVFTDTEMHIDSLIHPSAVTQTLLLPGIGAIPPAPGIMGMAAGIPIMEGMGW